MGHLRNYAFTYFQRPSLRRRLTRRKDIGVFLSDPQIERDDFFVGVQARRNVDSLRQRLACVDGRDRHQIFAAGADLSSRDRVS